jgi:hypothetical protein
MRETDKPQQSTCLFAVFLASKALLFQLYDIWLLRRDKREIKPPRNLSLSHIRLINIVVINNLQRRPVLAMMILYAVSRTQ